MLVYSFSGISKVMVQGCYGDALCQIDVMTYADWSYDGAMYANTRIVSNSDIAHGIVDTTV